MRDYKDYKYRRVRRKPSGKRLTPRLFKAGTILTVILAVAVAAGHSYRRLLTSDYFDLDEIVVGGEKRVKKDEIITLSGARIGGNILAVDLRGMAERIESHPWIEKATVRRVLPRRLSIDIREREPFAILKANRFFYLDRGGAPFKEMDAGDDTRYPVLTGLSVEEVENDEQARDALMKTLDFIETEGGNWPEDLAISEIGIGRDEGITAFSGRIEVRVGFGEYAIKIERLKRVMDDLKARGKTAEYIDLTYTGQVVVR